MTCHKPEREYCLSSNSEELKVAIVNAIQTAFGGIMLNLTLNNMLDGKVFSQQLNRYQLNGRY
ncbi:MAG: hypothetical protein WBX01_16700 [Nitrososphaeraceae archaeon]